MKNISLIVAGIIGILLLAAVTQGADQTVTLAWDANTETDLVGYNLYQGDSVEGPWDKVNTDVITMTEYAVSYTEPVEADKYYHVTATDGRNESGPSNIVATRIDTVAPATPGLLRITIEGSVQLIIIGPVL